MSLHSLSSVNMDVDLTLENARKQMKSELQYFVWRRCTCISQRIHSVIVARFFRGFVFKIAAWKLFTETL